jgi:hypothetical protein
MALTVPCHLINYLTSIITLYILAKLIALNDNHMETNICIFFFSFFLLCFKSMLFVVIIVKLMEMKIIYSLVKKFNLQFLLSLFIPFFFFNLFCFILFLFFISLTNILFTILTLF